MENNKKEEFFPRFENKGSINYLEQFDKETGKAKSVINSSFIFVTFILIFSAFFDFISISEVGVGFLLLILIFIIYSYLFSIIMLENFYTRAKISALKDEIK